MTHGWGVQMGRCIWWHWYDTGIGSPWSLKTVSKGAWGVAILLVYVIWVKIDQLDMALTIATLVL